MVSKIALIIFALLYGVNFFFPFAPAGLILAVDALILAIALMLGK